VSLLFVEQALVIKHEYHTKNEIHYVARIKVFDYVHTQQLRDFLSVLP
jgi:hypothetical protein